MIGEARHIPSAPSLQTIERAGAKSGPENMSREDPHTASSMPRVAVLVETRVGPGRDILCGIARYVRESGPWAIHLEARDQLFQEGWEPKWLNSWRGDGIIARFDTKSTLAAVKRSGIPAVDVLGDSQERCFPLVHVDDVAIANMAAEHLLERGFRQFGFVARTNEN